MIRRAFCLLMLVLASSANADYTGAAESATMPLLVHRDSFELSGRICRTQFELESVLKAAKPARIAVRPDPDAPYDQVKLAMEMIHRVGGIDVGITGSEHR